LSARGRGAAHRWLVRGAFERYAEVSSETDLGGDVAELEIVQVPQLKDNYAYVLHCRDEGVACVVDCSEPEAVLAVVSDLDARLVALWATHHHWDHIGGHKELLAAYPDLEVIGSSYDLENARVPGQTLGLGHGELITLGAHEARALHVPAHTLGHVAYYFEDAKAVFCGDTLFGAGCGRLFEGTPDQMNRALNEILGTLPGDTRVFCGHEYTESNLRFALHVDGDNSAVRERMEGVQRARSAGESTVPSRMDLELATNPFMRVGEPAIQEAARAHGVDNVHNPGEVLGAIRALKNSFS
jgi:hydroxyacylglutathione hydrolase